MTSTPKQWLISDLGNVLISFDHGKGAEQLAALVGQSKEAVFQWGFASSLLAQFETGKIAPEELLIDFNKTFNCELRMSDMQHAFSDIFAARPDMEQLLMRVKERGFGLALLSNTNEWHFDQCREQFPFLRLFDHFILSYEVGAMKPETKIWEAVFAKTCTAAKHCVYMDDMATYVDAATQLGVRSLLYTNTQSATVFLQANGLL